MTAPRSDHASLAQKQTAGSGYPALPPQRLNRGVDRFFGFVHLGLLSTRLPSVMVGHGIGFCVAVAHLLSRFRSSLRLSHSVAGWRDSNVEVQSRGILFQERGVALHV